MTAACSYRCYGTNIRSTWPLPLTHSADANSPDIELLEAPATFFETIGSRFAMRLDASDWFQHVHLPDGSDYLRWTGLFDFLVSGDGHRIWGHALPGGSLERLQTYLMGQVVSMAMVKQGIEPLHATAVVIDGQAVAFLGDSGFGKSTLGAAFVKAGFTILTDDLLVIERKERQFMAHPGPARLKLMPESADVLLPGHGASVTMNPATAKLVLSLGNRQAWRSPAPTDSLYILAAPDPTACVQTPEIRHLSRRDACISLVRNTFNTVIQGPARQARQFKMATELAASLEIRSLVYPRGLQRISEVVDAIVADVRHPDRCTVAA